jgi:hypothetical protein
MSAVTSAPPRVVTVNVPSSPAGVGGAASSGPAWTRQRTARFRTLLQRLSLHAATALDSTSADPCTTPPPEDC